MYILLIFIHSLFIFITHLFGYYLIEWVFIVLLLFFLLYFSPIFFFKKSFIPDEKWFFGLELSPQKSLIIPLVLSYFGVYILAFTFSGDIAASIHMHMLIFLAIYIIFLLYIFAFEWKKQVFFDISGFHLLFSYITLIIVGIYYFFSPEKINILDSIFSLVTLIFSVLFFIYIENPKRELFFGFLASLFFVLEINFFLVSPQITLHVIVWLFLLFAIVFFEYSEKIPLFLRFLEYSKIFFLSASLLFSFILSVLIFFSFEAIYFLFIATIFFFSVHIRYFNIITYSVGIFLLFFLYTFLFFSLLRTTSVFSSLVFIYFFSLVLIGNTYFWEEKQKYDFPILHYSSIGFSISFFLYSLLWFDWWEKNFIFTSFWLLLLATLFFLSYFRFYKK